MDYELFLKTELKKLTVRQRAAFAIACAARVLAINQVSAGRLDGPPHEALDLARAIVVENLSDVPIDERIREVVLEFAADTKHSGTLVEVTGLAAVNALYACYDSTTERSILAARGALDAVGAFLSPSQEFMQTEAEWQVKTISVAGDCKSFDEQFFSAIENDERYLLHVVSSDDLDELQTVACGPSLSGLCKYAEKNPPKNQPNRSFIVSDDEFDGAVIAQFEIVDDAILWRQST